MINEELSPIAQFIVNTMNNKALKDAHAIQRVRELHKPENGKQVVYRSKINGKCLECKELYPCPTIEALEGEQ